MQLKAIAGSRTQTRNTKEPKSLVKLRAILDDAGMRKKDPEESFANFEKRLHDQLQAVERDLVAEELERADVDATAIQVEGVGYRRVLRSKQTYMTCAGPVEVERALFKDRGNDHEKALVALDLKVGIIGKFWTPMAAEQAAWVVSQLTPQNAEKLFERMGNMAPSKSSLDRLPKELAERWNDDSKGHEEALRAAMTIPEEAVTVMASLDGVLAPMKDGDAVTKRARAAEEGKISKGPAGYREVGCAVLGFCDENGKLISAVRMAKMPEAHKASLKKLLRAELDMALSLRPDLCLVKAADGANDNWTYLHKELPKGTEVVDFFHAAEHLNTALASVYGDGTVEARRRFNDLRHVLLEEEDGVGKVIRSLAYLEGKHRQKKVIQTELAYFRKYQKRMRYAEMKAEGLPIGTGMTEAACKTLVTQRLKQSGMRWSQGGGQAILNLRGWAQSERFDQAWAMLAATYRTEITILNNVVSIRAV
jgi:hypothetical protein